MLLQHFTLVTRTTNTGIYHTFEKRITFEPHGCLKNKNYLQFLVLGTFFTRTAIIVYCPKSPNMNTIIQIFNCFCVRLTVRYYFFAHFRFPRKICFGALVIRVCLRNNAVPYQIITWTDVTFGGGGVVFVDVSGRITLSR